MRDLLSKLDKILLESAENTDANIQGKRKALQDIEKIPAAKDPEIKRAIDAKKAELGQDAPKANKGVAEDNTTKKLRGATPAPAPNPYLKDILIRHIDEVRHFVQTGYIDPTRPLFQELYEYFANEIPDSVRRSPWRLERRIGDMIAPYAKFYADQKLMNGQGTAEGDLKEFAPGGDGDSDEDPYKYPKPESYRRSADFFGKFEAGHFDREDFDDATGVFKGYWGPTQICLFSSFANPAKNQQ